MWYRSRLTPTWSEEYKTFPYTHKPPHSSDLEQWQRQGFNYQTFTGDMFSDQTAMPQWVHNIGQEIGLTDCGYTFYKMKPGIVMPKHIDHFERYCNIFNTERDKVYRAIVALENWQPGHIFEIENDIIWNYVKGEYIVWSADVPHAAANIGTTNRYTLQITGKKL